MQTNFLILARQVASTLKEVSYYDAYLFHVTSLMLSLLPVFKASNLISQQTCLDNRFEIFTDLSLCLQRNIIDAFGKTKLL